MRTGPRPPAAPRTSLRRRRRRAMPRRTSGARIPGGRGARALSRRARSHPWPGLVAVAPKRARLRRPRAGGRAAHEDDTGPGRVERRRSRPSRWTASRVQETLVHVVSTPAPHEPRHVARAAKPEPRGGGRRLRSTARGRSACRASRRTAVPSVASIAVAESVASTNLRGESAAGGLETDDVSRGPTIATLGSRLPRGRWREVLGERRER